MKSLAQINTYLNAEWKLTDKDGKTKKVFQDNALFRFLMKHGIVSPLFPKIPFILGYWSDTKKVRNLVTNAGFAGMAGLCNGSGAPAAFTYIAIGTGTTAAAVTDTTLGTELSTGGLGRAAATVSLVTTSVTNDTAQLLNTFTSSTSAAITESGVFNAASVGTLLCRQVFSVISVTPGNNLQITWKVQMH